MRKEILLATLSIGLLWSYLAFVFLLNEHIAGMHVGYSVVVGTLLVVCGFFYRLIQQSMRRGVLSSALLLNVTLCLFASLGSLLLADNVYTFYVNNLKYGIPELASSRYIDPVTSIGELYPHMFWPTDSNFRLHKPNVTVSGKHYGNLYSLDLAASPTLKKSVFRLNNFSCTIDEHGFRNTTPLEQANIFALGDSFTFGWAVNAKMSWVGRLEEVISRPIYNLGIHDSSPRQEVELIKYILRTQKGSVKVGHLLWMIFEGNDLEDSYALRRPEQPSQHRIFAGTLLEKVFQIPMTIKQEAMVTKLRMSNIGLRLPASRSTDYDPYTIDGIRSGAQFYRSSVLGPALFHPNEVDRAGRDLSYVLNHENRGLLDQVFEEMAQLAKEHSFKITVIVAPSVARLHGPFFDHFPPITKEAHFIQYVTKLSERMGFRTINQLQQLQPFASHELLYLRDDDHWNERGHELVANIVEREAF